MKRIVTLQDISCLGRCSVTVALPVISAMGGGMRGPAHSCTVHTHHVSGLYLSGSDGPDRPIARRHWKAQSIHFDAIYTGYLASPDQCDRVIEFFQDFRTPDGLIFVDPAMADGGKLYAALGPDFPRPWLGFAPRLISWSPNLTEACLLTGTPMIPPLPTVYGGFTEKLLDLGCRQVLLTGAEVRPGEVGVWAWIRQDAAFSYGLPRLPQSYHGTGDLFASACVGGLMNGLTLEQAARIAARFVSASISATAVNPMPVGMA